ncbi:MAG TPA: succinate dehydrogenase, cytochrome b556 subunit [Anaerolineaceae bacterium]
MTNDSSAGKLLRWFDPRHRKIGSWAFILNRITAIGLTIYLGMHLYMLGKLAQGPEAYNDFIELAHTPLIKFGEMFVIAGGLIHGLNGIRIGLTSFGIGVRYQKPMFVGLMVLAGAGIIIFGVKMFF